MRLFLIIMSGLILMGCAESQPISKSDFVLDTVASVTIYDGGSEEALNGAFSLCRYYEGLFSATISSSDIYRLNHAKGRAVTVSYDTIELLKTALYYSELTNGAFDVTIYSVSSLWDFKREEGRPPQKSSINEALKHVDYRKLSLDEGSFSVSLSDPAAEVDPGAIAKGYIGDKMRDYLISEGVKSAIINLGGNVTAIGEKPDGSGFRIGVKKPFSEENEVMDSFEVRDLSVVTSGSYERYFEYEGRLCHHILDPETGYPVENGLIGVTIISPESVDGDALSTACFVLGESKGRELIERVNREYYGGEQRIRGFFYRISDIEK